MKFIFSILLFSVINLYCFSQKLVIENEGCRVPAADREKIEKILKYEAVFYNNLFNTTKNDTLTVKVNLYGSNAAYHNAQGSSSKALHRTYGFYSPATDQCYVLKNSSYTATIIHEASHFFLQHNLPNNSRFLTEGIAEFFETLDVDDTGQIVFSQQEYRVKMVKSISQGLSFKLSDYLYVPDQQWGEKDQTQNLYSIAYSVVYYLMKKNPSILKQMLIYMQEGQSFEKAIEYSYGGYKNFESEYTYYYRKGGTKYY